MKLRRLLLGLGILMVLSALVFLLGPRPDFGEVNWKEAPVLAEADLKAFAKTVHAQEQRSRAKPEARAEVVFAKADSSKTEYAFVYLHGFSASRDEGSPVVDELATRYGANLYWTRLSDHGIVDPQTYATANPHDWREEALAMLKDAQVLGDKIIVIGTSTGATLALDLAAQFPELMDGLMFYSPNIKLANPAASMLNGPWGLNITRYLAGGETRTLTDIPKECDYIWTLTYRNEGLIALQELLELTMTEETFSKIELPIMSAYYYKSEEEKDNIVSTVAIETMMDQVGTVASKKRMHPLAEVRGHVITTTCRTTGVDRVREVSRSFLEEVIGLEPAAN